MHWTFVDQLRPDFVDVIDAEAHQLLHVLRVRPPQPLVLFDGAGGVADAVVESLTRRSVTCRVLQRRDVPRPSPNALSVAVSPPKGDRLRWMIEKLTEIGVPQIILLACERTVAEPGETRLEKLRSTAAAACKQSRQAWLPELHPITPFPDVLNTAHLQQQTIILAHPPTQSGDHLSQTNAAMPPAGDVQDAAASRQLLLIGPEGGFTDGEVDTALAAGATQLVWPGSILRIETAALILAALLLARQRQQ